MPKTYTSTTKVRWLLFIFFLFWLCTERVTGTLQVARPASLLNMQHSPAPYELAVLSQHAYRDDVQEGDPVVVDDVATPLADWQVVKLLQEKEDGLLSKVFQQLGLPYGYRGTLYLNTAKKQVVLAHRGTEFRNVNALKTDVSSIAANMISGQECQLPRLLAEALSLAEQENTTLSVTGHSLGGWLAQVTAFIAKDLYPDKHVKVVTFDAPGAYPMLEQINARNDPTKLEDLDITNYLSSPNLINASNQHVGTLYRVVFEQFANTSLKYTLASHAMANFINAFDPYTGQARRCVWVQDWPVVSKKSLTKAKKALTSNPANALLNLFSLLKDVVDQEHLGEYSGFLKLAHKANKYHLSGQDSFFARAYKYHYKTQPFDPRVLPVRNVPVGARQFLEGVHSGSPAHMAVLHKTALISSVQWDRENGILMLPYGGDMRLVADELISLAFTHPHLCKVSSLGTQHTPETNNLLPPPGSPYFVGRETMIKELAQVLATHKGSPVIAPPITGFGGVGKSQLALKVIAEQTRQYEHVFWIPAGSKEKLLDAYVTLARGLGLYVDARNLQQAVQSVRVHLQDRHCLYVFDDTPSMEAIQDFLPLQQGQGHVLITSRNNRASAWPKKAILVEPFSKAEALALAIKLGYGKDKQDQDALDLLLTQIPCYPLALVQFFNTLKDERYTPSQFLAGLQAYEASVQAQELIALLREDPHQGSVDYGKSVFYVFEKVVERLQDEVQGARALRLISQLAYIDPNAIPLSWLFALDAEDSGLLYRKTRAALSLLAQYSLLQWDEEYEHIYVHAETQLMMRHLQPQPQPSLTALVHRLITRVGTKEQAYQNLSEWSSLLPHGRALFKHIDTIRFPEEGYLLTKYLADACHLTSLFEEGAGWARQCLSIAQARYPNQDHPDVAHAFQKLGASLVELGKHAEALQYKQEALAMYKRLCQDEDHLDVAYAMSDVGSSLSQLGNYRAALQNQQEVLSMRKRLFPEQDHREIAHTINSIGELLSHLGDYAQALQYKQEGLAMRKRLFPNQAHPDVGRSLASVGIGFEQLGQHEEALAYKQEALSLRQRLHENKNHPDVGHSLNNVGETMLKLGQFEEGLVYCEQALALRQAIYGSGPHHYVAYSLNSIGVALTGLGRLQEGLNHSEQALAMLKEVYPGRDHPYMVHALNNISTSLTKLGRVADGMGYREEALAMQKRLALRGAP
jgi:tetratricopeptide (TPR) repeat protein